MALTAGIRLGPYEIQSAIGAGGMGEVYQARDTKLDRPVAIKILPESFAHDPERLARFEREAKTLASLNHPNIAIIHGFEESQGIQALVMELVEGPTLADRIAQGPIPLDEALPMAKQIAEAIEAAHEHGIIHRDLKPANIKLTAKGTVKVLDFGLAKALDALPAGANVSISPTLMSPATRIGVILGTAAYMSPEQARGQAVDKRVDIWAFGCVLYEMLTGRALFAGPTVSDTIASVLAHDLDWRALPNTTPPLVRSLIRRCLRRDRNDRTRDIGDARLQIEEALSEPAFPSEGRSPSRRRFVRAGWVAIGVAIVAAAIAFVSARRASIVGSEMRLQIVTPLASDASSFALSPDGHAVVFQALVQGRIQLWIRRLAAEQARPLEGTENATHPFWSPDSRSIGFFAEGRLKRLDVESGLIRAVAVASHPRGGAWNTDGTILFESSSGPLFRVSAEGGRVEEATRLLSQQTNHRLPRFLPDGQRFLLFALGPPGARGVYLGSLDTKDVHLLTAADSAAVFAPPHYLLFVRQGALWAQRLARSLREVDGEHLPVAPQVVIHPTNTGHAALSASLAESVAYRAKGIETQLTWFDRAGRQVGVLGELDAAQLRDIRLSHDGRKVVVQRTVDGNADVWLMETTRGVPQRLTSDPAIEGVAFFSPDGTRVLFASDRKAGIWDLYEKSADGTGAETLLFESLEQKNSYDWSPDGRHVIYASQSAKTDFDLWALPLFGDRKPVALAQTQFAEVSARFSPDGRFIAYQANDTGRDEIYVQPFPEAGAKTQVSIGGGRSPRWRRDGRELLYVGPANRLMAIAITQRGSTLDAAAPEGLFTLPEGSDYDPAPDGQRFLINRPASESSTITLLFNWRPPVSN